MTLCPREWGDITDGVLALGATLQQDSIGPDGYGWRVYTDPVGHPFCLCHNKGVTWTDEGFICLPIHAHSRDHRPEVRPVTSSTVSTPRRCLPG